MNEILWASVQAAVIGAIVWGLWAQDRRITRLESGRGGRVRYKITSSMDLDESAFDNTGGWRWSVRVESEGKILDEWSGVERREHLAQIALDAVLNDVRDQYA